MSRLPNLAPTNSRRKSHQDRKPIGKLQIIIGAARLQEYRLMAGRKIQLAVEDPYGIERSITEAKKRKNKETTLEFSDNVISLDVYDLSDTIRVLVYTSKRIGKGKNLIGDILISLTEITKRGSPMNNVLKKMDTKWLPNEALLCQNFFYRGKFSVIKEEKHESFAIARHLESSVGTLNLDLSLSLKSCLGKLYFTTPVRDAFVQPWSRIETFEWQQLKALWTRFSDFCVMPVLLQMVYKSRWKRVLGWLSFLVWFLTCALNQIWIIPWFFVSFIMLNGILASDVEKTRLRGLESQWRPPAAVGYMETYQNYQHLKNEVGTAICQRLGFMAETCEKYSFAFSYTNPAMTMLVNVILVFWALITTIAIQYIHRKWWLFFAGLLLARDAHKRIPKAPSKRIEDQDEAFREAVSKARRTFSVDSMKRRSPEERHNAPWWRRLFFNLHDHLITRSWADENYVFASQILADGNEELGFHKKGGTLGWIGQSIARTVEKVLRERPSGSARPAGGPRRADSDEESSDPEPKPKRGSRQKVLRDQKPAEKDAEHKKEAAMKTAKDYLRRNMESAFPKRPKSNMEPAPAGRPQSNMERAPPKRPKSNMERAPPIRPKTNMEPPPAKRPIPNMEPARHEIQKFDLDAARRTEPARRPEPAPVRRTEPAPARRDRTKSRRGSRDRHPDSSPPVLPDILTLSPAASRDQSFTRRPRGRASTRENLVIDDTWSE